MTIAKPWAEMTPLERITLEGQRTANREGRAVAVYNLGGYKPVWVVRAYDPANPRDVSEARVVCQPGGAE